MVYNWPKRISLKNIGDNVPKLILNKPSLTGNSTFGVWAFVVAEVVRRADTALYFGKEKTYQTVIDMYWIIINHLY